MIANGDVVVATGAIANGVVLKVREAVACAGKVMVWLALFTVNVMLCITEPCELVAVKVIGNVPAVVGVPVSVPTPEFIADVKTTPVGNVPACVIFGVGPPDVVMLNVGIAVATVIAGTMLLDVNAGGAMFTGVTMTVADAALLPWALVATTEHEYVFPLVSPLIVNGEAAPIWEAVAGIAPVQVAV